MIATSHRFLWRGAAGRPAVPDDGVPVGSFISRCYGDRDCAEPCHQPGTGLFNARPMYHTTDGATDVLK